MNARRAIQIGCALALGLVMYMPATHADLRNQEFSLSFDKPLQVSDPVILPAGTYWFRLADSTNMPNNVMEIFNDEGIHMANVITATADRGIAPLRVLGNHDYENYTSTKVEIAEGTDHNTLLKYFYKGEADGHKFEYSGHQEKMLSEEPTVTVSVTPGNHAASQTLSARDVQ